jgi:drug/metabolite transporter (DMT)-like permease
VTSAPRRQSSRLAVAVALLTVYVVWGSTYLGIAVMIETMPPLLAAGARFVSAGLIVLGVLVAHARLLRGATLERPTAAHWQTAAIAGTLLLLGGNGFVVLSELFIPSGVAAVVVGTTPIWLAAFDAAVTRRRPSALVVAGLVAGLAGVAVLLAPVEGIGELSLIGIGLALCAEVAWAIGSLYARYRPLPRSAFLGTGMEMLLGGIALLIAGALLGEVGRTDLASFSTRSVVAFAYLVVFGSIIAFTAYTWLLANVPVSTVATHAYVNPVVAVALGVLLNAEPITPRTIIATALIIGAIVAMVSGGPGIGEAPPGYRRRRRGGSGLSAERGRLGGREPSGRRAPWRG